MTKLTAQSISYILSQLWKDQFDTLESLSQKMSFNSDIETLHHFRVTLRQTRVLLKTCRPFLPDEARWFEKEFKWLNTATASIRNLDVQLCNQPMISRGDLSPIIAVLIQQRENAINYLMKQLKSSRFKRLIEMWGQFITTLPHLTTHISTTKHLKKLAKQQCKLLLHCGNLITKQSSARSLHQLRIKGKQLRYLLVTFAPYFSKQKKLRKLLKGLEKLQNILGKHQDAIVAIAQLESLRTSSAVAPESFSTLTEWITDLAAQQRTACKRLPKIYSSLTVEINQIGWMN